MDPGVGHDEYLSLNGDGESESERAYNCQPVSSNWGERQGEDRPLYIWPSLRAFIASNGSMLDEEGMDRALGRTTNALRDPLCTLWHEL